MSVIAAVRRSDQEGQVDVHVDVDVGMSTWVALARRQRPWQSAREYGAVDNKVDDGTHQIAVISIARKRRGRQLIDVMVNRAIVD